MATVKTVKPAGGGDYTTLAAWWTFAAAQATADQWAECYAGGDLGIVNISGGPTPSASNYPRIYTPLAERHNGKNNSTGAYAAGSASDRIIYLQKDYGRIEGIKVNVAYTGGGAGIKVIGAKNGVVIDSNLVNFTANVSGGNGIIFSATDPGTYSGIVIRNNIVYRSANAGFTGIYIFASSGGGNVTLGISVVNNTVDLEGASYAATCTGIGFNVTQIKNTVTENVVLKNNISLYNGATPASNPCFGFAGAGTFNWTAGYNCSSDATADDKGATGCLINQTPANIVTAVGSDWNLKSNSPCKDTGTDLSATFDWDALHLDADNWRPQDSIWDMGALELAGSAPPATITGPFPLFRPVVA